MKFFLPFLVLLFPLYSYDVIGFGDPLVDHIVLVEEKDSATIPDGRGDGLSVDHDTFISITKNAHARLQGGSMVNTLKGLSLLGRKTAAIGRIASCKESRQCLNRLKDYDITSHFTKVWNHMGQAACLIYPEGKWAMRTYIETDERPAFVFDEALFTKAKILHIEGYQIENTSFLREVIGKAKSAGCTISMDMGVSTLVKTHRAELLQLIEESVDILFANERQATILVGAMPELAAQKLAKLCKIAIVTSGANGGYVAVSGGHFHFPAYSSEVVDETGAGDLFIAGFLHGYLAKQPYEYCADCGAQMASKIVGVVGSEIPSTLWKKTLSKRTLGGLDHKIRKELMAQDISNGIQGCARR